MPPQTGFPGLQMPSLEDVQAAIAQHNLRTGRASPYGESPAAPSGGLQALVPPVAPAAAAPAMSQPVGLDGEAPPAKMPAQGATFNAIGPGYTEGVGVDGMLHQFAAKPGEQGAQAVPASSGWSGGEMQPMSPTPAATPGIPGSTPPDVYKQFDQFMRQQTGPYGQYNQALRGEMLKQFGGLEQVASGNAKQALEERALTQQGTLAMGDQALKRELGQGELGVRQGELGLKKDIFNEGKSDQAFASDLMAKNPAITPEQVAAAVANRKQAIGLMGGGQAGPTQQGPGAQLQLRGAADSVRPGAGTDLISSLAATNNDPMKAFQAIHAALGDQGVQANQAAIRDYLASKSGGTLEALRDQLAPSTLTKMLDVRNHAWGALGNSDQTLPVGDALRSLVSPSSPELRSRNLLRRVLGIGIKQ